jgi:hypothetical protein
MLWNIVHLARHLPILRQRAMEHPITVNAATNQDGVS